KRQIFLFCFENAIETKHRNGIRAVDRADTSNRNITELNVDIGRKRRNSRNLYGAFANDRLVLHAGNDFLSDIAALGKRNSVEQIKISFVRIRVSEFEILAADRNSELHAKRVVRAKRIGVWRAGPKRGEVGFGVGQKY